MTSVGVKPCDEIKPALNLNLFTRNVMATVNSAAAAAVDQQNVAASRLRIVTSDADVRDTQRLTGHLAKL